MKLFAHCDSCKRRTLSFFLKKAQFTFMGMTLTGKDKLCSRCRHELVTYLKHNDPQRRR